MEVLVWNPEDGVLLTGLLWTIIGFASYYFISMLEGPALRLSQNFSSTPTQTIQVILQRTFGLLFLGIIPAGIIVFGFNATLSEFGLNFRFSEPPPLWSYGLLPLIVLMTYSVSSTPSNLEHYPQIRSGVWTSHLLWISGASWVVFLIAYEFLFRGLLFFSSLSVLHPVPAIGLNVVLYAFAHFYKGPLEVIGAVPLGIILCYLTLITGNIWSAVVIHSVMALSHEWLSLRAHPHMKLTR